MYPIYRKDLSSFGLFLILLAVPFQWVVLFNVQGLSAKPVHFAIGAAVATIVLTWRSTLHALMRNRWFLYFCVSYFFYLAWLSIALLWSPDIEEGASSILKDSMNFFFFLVVSGLSANLAVGGRLHHTVGVASLCGLIAFVLYYFLLFAKLGFNLFEEYGTAVINADVVRLHHWFYAKLFNCSFDGSCVANDEGISASLRNTLLGAFIVYFIGISWWGRFGEQTRKALSTAALIVISCLIFLSVSRSAILVFVLVLAAYMLVKSVRDKSLANMRTMALLGFAAIVGVAVPMISGVGSVSTILDERFGSLDEDSRVAQYENALDLINDSIFLGHGLRVEVETGLNESLTVHNLFLASWTEAGIVGALLASAWYAIALLAMLREMFSGNVAGKRMPLWLCLLPILPLFRVLVSGSGRMTLVELISLGLFFGAMCNVTSFTKYVRRANSGLKRQHGAVRA
ncbi:MAG: O-antigen ligase family protein [Pseudomonadota bacterium]